MSSSSALYGSCPKSTFFELNNPPPFLELGFNLLVIFTSDLNTSEVWITSLSVSFLDTKAFECCFSSSIVSRIRSSYLLLKLLNRLSTLRILLILDDLDSLNPLKKV